MGHAYLDFSDILGYNIHLVINLTANDVGGKRDGICGKCEFSLSEENKWGTVKPRHGALR